MFRAFLGFQRLLLGRGAALVPALVLLTPSQSALSVDEPRVPVVVRCLLEPVDIDPLSCASAILVEADTGTVLYEQEADAARPPASLVKIMVQLITLREVEAGTLSLSDSVETSANASTMGGSQVFLKHGEKQTVYALLQAVAIASANDAAMALAEHIAESEDAFVARMNAEAEQLGCPGTRFANVHGLDLRWQPQNLTTARDLSLMARELLKYPLALEISSTWRAPFRGGLFWLDNTNKLLRRYEGLDGLKTGYTPRAGGCFCGTATRNGVRLVSVVMKARPGRARFDLARRLLDAGFDREPRWIEAVEPEESLVALGPVARLGRTIPSTVAGGRVRVLLEDSRRARLRRRIRPRPDLDGPIVGGDLVGYVDCRIDGRTFASVPARAVRGD